MAMVEAGDPQAGGNIQERENWIPTLFKWGSIASEVYVIGSWDDWTQMIKLESRGQYRHSAVNYLQKGQYRFVYLVDGTYTCDPSMQVEATEKGARYNLLSVDESNEIPMLIEWTQSATEVSVFGSWNGYEVTKLHNHGPSHSVWVHLRPGKYWFYYHVDGAQVHNPFLSWEAYLDGRKYNFLSIEMPRNKPKPYWGCTTAITLTSKGESVQVMGSWDSWKHRVALRRSEHDHYIHLILHSGAYHMKYIVDGKDVIRQDVEFVCSADGHPIANIVNAVRPTSHYLDGVTSGALIDDLISMTGKALSVATKFNVGSRIGNIDSNVETYPCTDFGFMLLAILGFIKQTYVKGYSWGGCFGPNDMTCIDGKYCQIKAEAKLPLTRAHVVLDSFQLKKCLLSRFEKGGKYPPYFQSLFSFLDEPPADFDWNQAAKAEFLDLYDNQAALANPPRRMIVLINMAQFFKQLPEKVKSKFAQAFMPLLHEYSDWQKTAREDALLKLIYLHKRKKDTDNSSLEMTNFLRVFFVHGPEHTLVKEVQLLKAYTELDLIIAYYYEKLFADLIRLIRENINEHPLIKAIWDFYLGGSPPDHYEV